MRNTCPLCGREKPPDMNFCEYCQYTVCEFCKIRLARGYCAVCGRLVCNEDSKMIGFARVCNECLQRDPRLKKYDYLKSFIRKKALELNAKRRKKIKLLNVLGNLNFMTQKYVYLHVGIDDADSPYGMCTTYLGATLFEKLTELGDPMDYPLLVRLNPNIPMKTRGNAAIALRFKIMADILDTIKTVILETIEKLSHTFFHKTATGLAIYITPDYAIDGVLYEIYLNALQDVLPLSILNRMSKKLKYGYLELYGFNERWNGIIGSLSAIGAVFNDYTFELTAYRREENVRTKRKINPQTVITMDKKFAAYTFGNIDDGRLLISPVGPDPVLLGIRGDIPEKLVEAFKIVEHEPISLWCLFRTNQGTNAHIRRVEEPSEARPYQTILIEATVSRVRSVEGKVIVFASAKEWSIEATAYKIQKNLRNVISKLLPGDTVLIIGNVVERRDKLLKLNLEEILTISLIPYMEERNPVCPYCGKRLKKKGKDIYLCKRCGIKFEYKHKLTLLYDRNGISEKKRYEAVPKAQRHLTLPTKRLFYRAWKISGIQPLSLIMPLVGHDKNILVTRRKPVIKLKIIR